MAVENKHMSKPDYSEESVQLKSVEPNVGKHEVIQTPKKLTVFHNLSGGIDSTSVLMQLTQMPEVEKIYVHHLNIKTKAGRWRSEQLAVRNILDWFERQGKTFENIATSEIEFFPKMPDIELVGFFAGALIRQREDVNTTTFSTSNTDRQNVEWIERHVSRVHLIEHMTRRKLHYLKPNWNKDRQQVMNEMPRDLLNLCSFCRKPGMYGTFKPCGNCKTCKVTLPYL